MVFIVKLKAIHIAILLIIELTKKCIFEMYKVIIYILLHVSITHLKYTFFNV